MSQQRRQVADFGKHTVTEADFDDGANDDLIFVDIVRRGVPAPPPQPRKRGRTFGKPGADSSDEEFGEIINRIKKEKHGGTVTATGTNGTATGLAAGPGQPARPRWELATNSSQLRPIDGPAPARPQAPLTTSHARPDASGTSALFNNKTSSRPVVPAINTSLSTAERRPAARTTDTAHHPPPAPPPAKPSLNLFPSLQEKTSANGGAAAGGTAGKQGERGTKPGKEGPRSGWVFNPAANAEAWKETLSAAAAMPLGKAALPGASAAAAPTTNGEKKSLFSTANAAEKSWPTSMSQPAANVAKPRAPAKNSSGAAKPAPAAAIKAGKTPQEIWPTFWPDLVSNDELKTKADVVHRTYDFEAPATPARPTTPPRNNASATTPGAAKGNPASGQRRVRLSYDGHLTRREAAKRGHYPAAPPPQHHWTGYEHYHAPLYGPGGPYGPPHYGHPPGPGGATPYHWQPYHCPTYGYSLPLPPPQQHQPKQPLPLPAQGYFHRHSPLPDDVQRTSGEGRRLPTLAEQNLSFPKASPMTPSGGDGSMGGKDGGPSSEIHVVRPGNTTTLNHSTAWAGYGTTRASTPDLDAVFDNPTAGERRNRRLQTPKELVAKRAAGRAAHARRKTDEFLAKLRADQPQLGEAELAKAAADYRTSYEADQDERVRRLERGNARREMALRSGKLIGGGGKKGGGKAAMPGRTKLGRFKKRGRPPGSGRKKGGAAADSQLTTPTTPGGGESDVSEEDPDSESDGSDADDYGLGGGQVFPNAWPLVEAVGDAHEVDVSRVAAAPDARRCSGGNNKKAEVWARELLNVYTVIRVYEGPPVKDEPAATKDESGDSGAVAASVNGGTKPPVISHGLAPVRVKSYLRRLDANHLAAELVHRSGTRSKTHVQRVSLLQEYASDCVDGGDGVGAGVGGGANTGGTGGLYRAISTFVDGSREEVYVVREVKQVGDLGKLPYDRPWATGERRKRWDVWEVRILDLPAEEGDAEGGDVQTTGGGSGAAVGDDAGHDQLLRFQLQQLALQQQKQAQAKKKAAAARKQRRKARHDDDDLFGSDPDESDTDGEAAPAPDPRTPAGAATTGLLSRGGSAAALQTPAKTPGHPRPPPPPVFEAPRRLPLPGGKVPLPPPLAVEFTTPRLIGSYTDRTLANNAAAEHFLRAVKPRAARIGECMRHERYVLPRVRELVAELAAWDGGGRGGGGREDDDDGGGLFKVQLEALEYTGYDWRMVMVWVGESELRGPMN